MVFNSRLLGPVALVLAGAATACARLPGPPRPSSRHGNVLVARKVWGFSDEKEEVTTTTSTTTTDATTTTTEQKPPPRPKTKRKTHGSASFMERVLARLREKNNKKSELDKNSRRIEVDDKGRIKEEAPFDVFVDPNNPNKVIELTTASESATESTSAAEKKKTAKPKKQDKKKDDKKKKKENIFQRSWGGVKKAFGWMKEKVKKLFSHN